MLWGLLFPALVLWAVELGVGLGPLTHQGGPLQLDFPPYSQPPHMGVGQAPFSFPPLLPVLG